MASRDNLPYYDYDLRSSLSTVNFVKNCSDRQTATTTSAARTVSDWPSDSRSQRYMTHSPLICLVSTRFHKADESYTGKSGDRHLNFGAQSALLSWSSKVDTP
eukprot:scaffold6297_cov69-Cyclotella_meneghiniana.AAC.1